MREQAMFFGDRPLGGRYLVVDKHVEFDNQKRCWVSTPIRIYVGPKALEVKK